ncbi:MAG: DUF3120 domain-containing protein [Cyanobacterium sp.]
MGAVAQYQQGVWRDEEKRQSILIFLASAFLVSIPVFFQAPLVRTFPFFSLFFTLVWVFFGLKLQSHSKTHLWGDIIIGFSWSWLCGSIYWGWLRWTPAIHIPIEAIGLPFVLWGIWRGWGLIGNYFYLGSLLGTAITDLYFYIAGLIPYWVEIMDSDPSLIKPMLQGAIAQVNTPWGISWAILLANILLAISLYALQKKKLHYLAFAGAVLSTIVTDGLFLVAAYFGVGG